MEKRFSPASVKRIKADIESLAQFNATPGEGITRVALSQEDLAAREFVKSRMAEMGLEVSEDDAANIFGVLPGSDRSLSPVWTGSHIDTVPNGGQFDGMSGVVCAFETLRLMAEAGFKPRRDICVVVYMSEEPSRYGVGCVGSRALAGKLSPADAKRLVDADGVTLYEKLSMLGHCPDKLSLLKKESGAVHASVELHIEQGEVLEKSETTIGAVHTISAPSEMHVTIVGRQSHAGATPMELRCDPMAAAAEVVLFLEKSARGFKEPSTVATVGRLLAVPNATNVIPARVEFSVDMRSAILEDKELMLSRLEDFLESVKKERGVTIDVKMSCNDVPREAEPRIVSMIEEGCALMNYSCRRMASGAYHDSMLVAEFAPFGMIFVPSRGGISHDRREWTDYEDIAKGADVLALTLAELASEI